MTLEEIDAYCIRVENIITRDDNKLITVGDFQRLLDTNGFTPKK